MLAPPPRQLHLPTFQLPCTASVPPHLHGLARCRATTKKGLRKGQSEPPKVHGKRLAGPGQDPLLLRLLSEDGGPPADRHRGGGACGGLRPGYHQAVSVALSDGWRCSQVGRPGQQRRHQAVHYLASIRLATDPTSGSLSPVLEDTEKIVEPRTGYWTNEDLLPCCVASEAISLARRFGRLFATVLGLFAVSIVVFLVHTSFPPVKRWRRTRGREFTTPLALFPGECANNYLRVGVKSCVYHVDSAYFL